MAMGREVVRSLELLAPGRARAQLHKAVARARAAAARQQQQQQQHGASSNGSHVADADTRSARGWRRNQQQQQQQGGQPGVPPSSRRSCSLFGFLDHTSTTCGARLLRTNLLQPLTDITTLELRQDSLQVCSSWSLQVPVVGSCCMQVLPEPKALTLPP